MESRNSRKSSVGPLAAGRSPMASVPYTEQQGRGYHRLSARYLFSLPRPPLLPARNATQRRIAFEKPHSHKLRFR